MLKLTYSLLLIIGGLVIGQIIYIWSKRISEDNIQKMNKAIYIIRNIAFLGLAPVATLSAFWIVDLSSISIIIVPFIGLGALVLGSVSAYLLARIFKHNRKEQGAMFCCGSSSNLGNIGSLLCFALFGEVGFAFSALYRLFEPLYLCLIVYPTAKTFSIEKKDERNNRLLRIIKDPIVLVYFTSIFVGFILNFSGAPRPSFVTNLNSIIIPLTSFLLIVAIGYTMRLSKISNYKKEIVGISFIKYVLTPIVIISISLILNLDEIANGVLFKTIVVLCALPCGFNSLISTQMYKLDINLANSCWIVTTGLLVVVIPLIWIFIG
jgi:predicted permease